MNRAPQTANPLDLVTKLYVICKWKKNFLKIDWKKSMEEAQMAEEWMEDTLTSSQDQSGIYNCGEIAQNKQLNNSKREDL